MKKIAIIGGGWAGLSCAHALKQRKNPSAEIWLFEASPHAGGRARGIGWETELGETAVDNGQHLLIGAYSQTWQLLRDAGVLLERAWSDSVLHWASYTPDRPAGYELLRVPPSPGPGGFLGKAFPPQPTESLHSPGACRVDCRLPICFVMPFSRTGRPRARPKNGLTSFPCPRACVTGFGGRSLRVP